MNHDVISEDRSPLNYMLTPNCSFQNKVNHSTIKMTHISQDEKISNGGLVLENLSDMEWNIAGNYIQIKVILIYYVFGV